VYLGETTKGGSKRVRSIERYLDDPTIHTKQSVKFVPPPRVCPSSTLNTFTGWEMEYKEPEAGRDIKPFLSLVLQLVGGGVNFTHQAYVLDWLAHAVQRPGRDGADGSGVRVRDAGHGQGDVCRHCAARRR
jgi:hypothetical protein